MPEEASETPQRWTAKRRAVLVLSIEKGETSAQAAARKHGLMVARPEGEPAEVDLGLLPRLRLEAHRRRHGAPESEGLEVAFQDRVAAGVPLRPQLAEQHDGVLDAGARRRHGRSIGRRSPTSTRHWRR